MQNKRYTEWAENMREMGISRPSTSPWAARSLIVRKKDGSDRYCVDYRALNAQTISDTYPLPRIDSALDAFAGSIIFSTLDLCAGYWQVRIAEKDKYKTAFLTPAGLDEFNVMPFGLMNAPATFQRMMDVVLSGLSWKSALVYLDDIIVFSRSFEDHLKHLEEVFTRLKNANLSLKAEKCHFGQAQVLYLGHVVSAQGIRADPGKVSAVQNFPTPKDVSSLRSFLGLANYFRRFIYRFSHVAAPLNAITSKNVPWNWTEECNQAFLHLKEALISPPLLAHPNFEKEFFVFCEQIQGIGLVILHLSIIKNG
jgi:hypothetical protein